METERHSLASISAEVKDLYDIAQAPPLGHVPRRMHAWVIRRERFGEPLQCFRQEVVDVPPIGDRDVLVYLMAVGINYNAVWAGRGKPVDIIPKEDDFFVPGTDGAGIVYRVGPKVTGLRVGDEVTLGGVRWDPDCPSIQAGGDPCFSKTYHIHGYEANWGTFAQFSPVQEHQCRPKIRHLTWEQAGGFLASALTSFRMLHRWHGNTVRAGDVVLVWGGSGGLGCQAIQIAREAGALPVAVISDDAKAGFCHRLGAVGCVNRTRFGHWGQMPHWTQEERFHKWMRGDGEKGGVIAFGKAIWEAVGEKRNPRIVIEHPGEDTLATSMFVCETGGMVVCCAGTTGYSPVLDLRPMWMRQKRFQGSHAGNLDDIRGADELVAAGKVDPCVTRTFAWDELPLAHQLMADNRHQPGNMAVLVGAPGTGLGADS